MDELGYVLSAGRLSPIIEFLEPIILKGKLPPTIAAYSAVLALFDALKWTLGYVAFAGTTAIIQSRPQWIHSLIAATLGSLIAIDILHGVSWSTVNLFRFTQQDILIVSTAFIAGGIIYYFLRVTTSNVIAEHERKKAADSKYNQAQSAFENEKQRKLAGADFSKVLGLYREALNLGHSGAAAKIMEIEGLIEQQKQAAISENKARTERTVGTQNLYRVVKGAVRRLVWGRKSD